MKRAFLIAIMALYLQACSSLQLLQWHGASLPPPASLTQSEREMLVKDREIQGILVNFDPDEPAYFVFSAQADKYYSLSSYRPIIEELAPQTIPLLQTAHELNMDLGDLLIKSGIVASILLSIGLITASDLETRPISIGFLISGMIPYAWAIYLSLFYSLTKQGIYQEICQEYNLSLRQKYLIDPITQSERIEPQVQLRL